MIASLLSSGLALLCLVARPHLTAGQDPYWTGPEAYQDKTLAKYSYFGSSVAISKEVFAVGAPFDFDEDQTVRGGSVSLFDVYYTSDSSLEKIYPDTPVEDMSFGMSVAITPYNLAVSSYLGNNGGTVHLYRHSYLDEAFNFSFFQKIDIPTTRTNENTTIVVAMCEGVEQGVEGQYYGTVLVAMTNIGDRGGVNVYHIDNQSMPWKYEQTLEPEALSPVTMFGGGVAIFAKVLAVSSYDDEYNGYVSIFTRNTEKIWTYQREIQPFDGGSTYFFGYSISLNFHPEEGEGNSENIALAASDPAQGLVYIFVYHTVEEEWVEEDLIASPNTPGEGFGTAVSVYQDYIAITTFDYMTSMGNVSVYMKRNESGAVNWTPMELTIPEEAQDPDLPIEFGSSVATNGVHVAVGASSYNDEGIVYMYTEIDTPYPTPTPTVAPMSWYLASEYRDQTPRVAHFGHSVSMHQEVFAVGAPMDLNEATGANTGSVSVFDMYTSGAVVELHHPEAASTDSFGSAVTVGVHCLGVGATKSGQGVVYMYTYAQTETGFSFTYTDRFAGSGDADKTQFGSALAVVDTVEMNAPEGAPMATLAVGAPPASGNTAESGAVFVYTRQDSTSAWIEKSVITPGEAGVMYFGQSVSMYSSFLAIGSDTADGGKVFIYKRNSNLQWDSIQQVMASVPIANDKFSFSMSLSLLEAGVETYGLIVGAPATESAHAFVYDVSTGSWSEHAKLAAPKGGSGEFGYSVALYDTNVVIGSRWAAVGGAVFAYEVMNMSNTITFRHTTTLDPFTLTEGSQFGSSLAMYGQHFVTGAPGYNGDEGNAYLYVYSETAPDLPTAAPTVMPTAKEGSDSTNEWSLETFDSAAILLTVLLVVGAVGALGVLYYVKVYQSRDMRSNLLSKDSDKMSNKL